MRKLDISKPTRTHTRTHVHTHTNKHTYIHARTHIHTHTHTDTHIHTYTHPEGLQPQRSFRSPWLSKAAHTQAVLCGMTASATGTASPHTAIASR